MLARRDFCVTWALALSISACQQGERGNHSEGGVPSDQALQRDARTSAEDPIRLPATIQDLFRVPPERAVVAMDDVTIGPNGRLEVSPGDIVKFAKGKGLFVRGGQLMAAGTAVHRIVFTSLADKPSPGDWCGLVFNAGGLPKDRTEPWPGSVLEHVIVEFAGSPWSPAKHMTKTAGITIAGYLGDQKRPTLAGAVTLNAVEIRDNKSRGIDAQSDAPVSAREMRFGKNDGVSMTIDVAYADHVAPAATEPVELMGTILRTPMSLPAVMVPYVVVETIAVGGWPNDPLAVLTIPRGSTLKFRKGAGLSSGGYFSGRIEAHGVVFTSAEPEPHPGDWEGIQLSKGGAADFSDDTFEYAGSNGQPVLDTSARAATSLEVRTSLFRRNGGPAFGNRVTCERSKIASRRNVFEDQPPCSLKRAAHAPRPTD